MKIYLVLIAFVLSASVKGFIWAAARQGIEPIIMSFGVAFAALGLNYKPDYVAHSLINLIINKKRVLDMMEEKAKEEEKEKEEYLEKLKERKIQPLIEEHKLKAKEDAVRI